MPLRTDFERLKREIKWRLHVSWWHCYVCNCFENGRPGWRGYRACGKCDARMRNLDRLFSVVVELVERNRKA